MRRIKKTVVASAISGALLILMTGCSDVGPGVVSPASTSNLYTYEKGTIVSFRYLSLQPGGNSYASPNAQELTIRLDSGRVVRITTRGTSFRREERIRVVKDGNRIVNVQHIIWYRG